MIGSSSVMAAQRDFIFDVTVIGAGIEGSATAYQLSKMGSGKKIALVEQFTVGHSRGSSHGGSRITRMGYSKAFYTEMMKECFSLWGELELESGKEIYVPTGGVYFGPKTSKSLLSIAESLEKQGLPHEVMDAEEGNKRVPMLNLPLDYMCIMDKNAGVLKAPNALKAFQGEFVKNGGVLLENCKVEKIVPGSIVKLHTSKGIITTRKLVITAGAWAPRLLDSIGLKLPLQVWRPNVLYWQVEDENNASVDNFPVFIHFGHDEIFDVYGLPICEFPGLVKICQHYGWEVDPDNRDLVPGVPSIPKITEFIRKHFNSIATKPSIVETCMYTVSPDHDLILDTHPTHPTIVFGTGFSGHGFKMAPVVGKILSELALDLPPSYDLKPFSAQRFSEKGKL